MYFQHEGSVRERQLCSLNFCAALRFSMELFLTAWDGITWELFRDVRVCTGEICVGFFCGSRIGEFPTLCGALFPFYFPRDL